MLRERMWIGLLLCLLMLPTLSFVPVLALDDSDVKVTVSGDSFHVEVDLIIQISVDDKAQFTNAEDAYKRDAGTFRGKLRESIEDAVQEHVSGATVPSIEVDSIECDEAAGKMHVEISFDVDGAISGGVYDLTWRQFKADGKFSCEDRTVDPSEALGLDFSGFNDELDDEDDWTVEESSGNTVIRQKREYEIAADEGAVDLRVTMKFTVPGTGLTVGDDKVTSGSASTTTTATSGSNPILDFFVWLFDLLFGWL